MSLIPNLSDIPELTLAEDGEYDLHVTTAKEKASPKTGRNSIMLVCDFVGEDDIQNLIHSIWLPMESDDKTKAETMWRMIKEFLTAVGLPSDGDLDIEDFKGLDFTAIIEIESSDFGDRNIIKRIV